MLPVHGFYGHVRHNDLLSVVMFAGFLLALQLLAAVVLFLPLLIYDIDHAPGVVGPSGMRPRTSWEIHPVTKLDLP